MAQELREGDGKSGIARAGKRKWGLSNLSTLHNHPHKP